MVNWKGREVEHKEWEMWKEMCLKMGQVFNVSADDFGQRKDIREVCEKIGNWAYAYALLREYNKNKIPDMKPIFNTIENEWYKCKDNKKKI